MLQLLNICKSYTTADFTQTALDNVSVSFRDNEFVAILGPSGSGKTTLLNIVGGLDHYDSGNLVIDGISTDEYKDRDWDAYRNNRIGFVFQSYNLIPHQTVLSNVELALTLSGVSRAERRERAIEALKKVGLGDHVNKKPSQLSGGQMQRVAIARALINDPEILLADEPTGALDSKTSVQIMDLLTEIANDRLVIMVTHNPELAEDYATRIVTLTDGVIRSDTDPYEPTAEDMRVSEKPARRTKMSFLTALSLSFKNLMTKKGRTLMTAFAGSIGIIGIAAILALANGVNNYIKSVEEETLSEYPLQIQSTGFDMTSMMFGAAGESSEASGDAADKPEDSVHVVEMVSNMVSSIGSNDLASLKKYLDSGESDIDQYTNAIEYTYNVAPQIYSSNTEKLRQVNPDKSFSALGLGSSTSSNSLMSMSMSTDTFYEMPSDPDLYQNQYDVKAGRWPESPNEVVLVLTGNGGMSDLMLYTLGLRDPAELDDMVKKFAAEEEIEAPADIQDPSYEDILDVSFKLVNAADYYQRDDEFNVWKDKTDDTDYMRELVKNGEDINVVGVVQPRDDATATMLSSGLNYPASLTTYVIDQAANSAIVKDQLAHPDTNVFTGKSFDDEEADESGFNMESLFTIDGDAIQAAFTIDQSKLSVDMSNALNLQGSLQNMPAVPEPNMDEIAGSLNIDLPVDQVSTLMSNLMEGYAGYLKGFYENNSPLLPDGSANPSYDPNATPKSAQEWMSQPEIQAQIMAGVQGMIDQDALKAQLATALQSYVQTTMTTYMTAMANVPANTTLLRVDAAGIRERLLKNAWVADAEVKRVFPNTLELAVTERTIAAVVAVPTEDAKSVKRWAIASDHMWLMPIPDQDSEAGKRTSPKVYEDAAAVLSITDVPYGTKAEIGTYCSDDNVSNALDIVSGMTTELAGRVTKVSATDAEGTTLTLDDNVEIAFGKAENIRDKERVVLKIMEENPTVVYINVRVVDRPTWRAL